MRRIRVSILAAQRELPLERATNARKYKPIPQFTERELARFWERVDRQGPTACWLWTGGTTIAPKGGVYGVWRGFRPHRVAYTLLVGPIPEDHTLDHLRESGICSSTLCCNPAHLEAVTQSENTKRYRRSLPRICQRGHEMDPRGNCKECIRIKTREWYARNKDRLNAKRRQHSPEAA